MNKTLLLIFIFSFTLGCQSEKRISDITRPAFTGKVLMFTSMPNVKYDTISEFEFQKDYYGRMKNYLDYIISEAKIRGANGIIDLKTGYGIWRTMYPWASGKFVFIYDYESAKSQNFIGNDQ